MISDSHAGIIFPKGLLGNVWRHFCFHGLGVKAYLWLVLEMLRLKTSPF